MNNVTIAFMVVCLVLTVVPPYFIINAVYKDGVIGRIALAGISFFAASFWIGLWVGERYIISWQALLLVTSFTAFLIWHLWKFHRRQKLRNHERDGKEERREVSDRRYHDDVPPRFRLWFDQ